MKTKLIAKALLLLSLLSLQSFQSKADEPLDCVVNCEIVEYNKTVLVHHPDYPNCDLYYVYHVKLCPGNVVQLQLQYFWVDATDPDCSQLISDLNNSSVQMSTFLNLVTSAPRLTTEALFNSLPLSAKLQFPCPSSYKSYQFLNASCVALYATTANPLFRFNLTYCGQACCVIQINACYNTVTGQSEFSNSIVESDIVPSCNSLDPIPPGEPVFVTPCFPICYVP